MSFVAEGTDRLHRTSSAPWPECGIYSGTAAVELRELHAPALAVIARINELSRSATMVWVLPSAERWGDREACQWLAPVGRACEALDQVHPIRPWVYDDVGTRLGMATEVPEVSTILVDLSDVEAEVDSPESHVSPAFDAFKDLVRWLDANDEEVANMIGIGRTTHYSWKRDGREPHRSTVRRLFQTHAVLAALVNRLGEPAVTTWLAHEDGSRRERILAGDLPSVQEEMRPLLFARRRPRVRPGSWVPDEELDE